MMVEKQSIRQNLKWLAVVNAVSKPVWFIFLMYSARALGPAEFGQYMLSIGVISLFTGLMEGGVDIHTLRTLAADNRRYRSLVSQTVWIKILTGCIAFGVAYIVGSIVPAWMPAWTLFLTAAVYGISNLVLTHLRIVFRSFEVMKYEAVTIAAEKVLVMVLCGAALFLAPNAESFGAMFALAYAMVCIAALIMVFRVIGVPDRPRDLWKNFLAIIRPSLPFAMMNMFIILYLRSGTLLLSYLTGDDRLVGYFNAGFRLVEAFVLIPSILIAPLYPVWTRSLADVTLVRKLSLDALRLILAVSIMISFPIALYHQGFTELVLGAQYAPASIPVGIICLSMVPIGLNWIVGSLVAIAGKQRIANWFILTITVLNITLHVHLIQAIGVTGAAVTVLITEALVMLSNWWIIKEYIPFRSVARILSGIMISLIIPIGLALAYPDTQPLFGMGLTIVLLMIGFFVTGIVTWSDSRTFFRTEGSIPSETATTQTSKNQR